MIGTVSLKLESDHHFSFLVRVSGPSPREISQSPREEAEKPHR